MSIKQVMKGGMVQALIIYPNDGYFDKPESGLRFYTHQGEQIQVACMVHPAGHEIPLHSHKEVHRSVWDTPEVLFVRKGRVAVMLDTDNGYKVYGLVTDDVLILFRGAHGFKVLEDCEIWEVKTGPYLGKEEDKIMLSVQLWKDGPTY